MPPTDLNITTGANTDWFVQSWCKWQLSNYGLYSACLVFQDTFFFFSKHLYKNVLLSAEAN